MRLEKTLVIVVVVVFALAAGIAGVKMSRIERRPEAAPPESGTVGLVVVGIEGLELSIVDRLAEEGRLPNLKELMREGATGEFANLGRLTDGRVSWTSLATGVSPENQGIGGKVMSPRGDMIDAPLTPDYRTVGTLWTALSERGSAVAVLSWPGTWPVEEIRGVMVGPYEHYFLEREHQGNPLEAVHPIARHAELDRLILGRGTSKRKDLTRFVVMNSRLGLEALIGKSYETLDVATAGDRSMVALSRHLAADSDIEAIFVVLDGLEDVSQRFWHYAETHVLEWDQMDRETRRLLEGQVEALGSTIDRYYEFVDELLGELVALVDDGGTVAVVTDHGYAGLEMSEQGDLRIGRHMHSDEGLWIIRGPKVLEGVRVDGGSLIDFAPTLAAAASIPVPDTVEGAACEAALVR